MPFWLDLSFRFLCAIWRGWLSFPVGSVFPFLYSPSALMSFPKPLIGIINSELSGYTTNSCTGAHAT